MQLVGGDHQKPLPDRQHLDHGRAGKIRTHSPTQRIGEHELIARR